MLTVSCKGKTIQLPEGATFEDAAKQFRNLYEKEPLLAITGDFNHATELFHKIYGDVELKFLTHDDLQGRRAYMRSAEMMLLRAISEEFPDSSLNDVKVELGVDGNLFLSLGSLAVADEKLTERLLSRMNGYVKANDRFEKKTLNVYRNRDLLNHKGLYNLKEILKFRTGAAINYYSFGDFFAYFYGSLCSSSGYIREFDLKAVDGGLMLILPKAKDTEGHLNPVYISKKSFDVQKNSVYWAEKLGIDDVSGLNEAICTEKMSDVILMQEAYFEKQLGDIAAKISDSGKKVVLLAGPSSSGKTTTSYRLAIQMRAFGIKPVIISADNYFVDHDKRPLGPDGKPDLESITVVDTELLNKDILKLIGGESVEIPSFNFVSQKREYKGNVIKLGPENVLIMEGIHCLNPVFSEKIPDDEKFRIFISALTPLSINSYNPIPTSDMRLLRRMVRDNRTRGYSAANTIAQWDNVRGGEEKNILPYQDNADVIINSAMVYEISVLRLFVEPLLLKITPDQPEYIEARRLLKLISFALPVNPEVVPRTSILREFIGGSCIDID